MGVRAVGLISGTSMDAIEAAAVEIDDGSSLRVQLRAHCTVPYPSEVRAGLLALCRADDGRALDASRLTMVLGELFADAAQMAVARAGWRAEEVHLIGSHGQTTVSDMTDGTLAGRRTYATLQLAHPAVIAERTGITVVADFRARDIAAGGRGAPLVPMLDVLLYAVPGRARVLLNLGGIANVTLIPASNDPAQVIGFDTGPANMPLDALMRLTTQGSETFDRDGGHAAQGRVDQDLLCSLLAHPFVQALPPKATGSEDFGEAYVARLLAEHSGLSRADLLATLARFAAEAVAAAIRRWFPNGEQPDDVVASGGGIHNATLMGYLTEALAPIRLRTLDEIGGQAGAKEAIAFAVLGYLTLRGRAGNLPSVTGAAHPVPLGSITPGRLGADLLGALL
ncbi:MAG TPA: anhydro-N-acetylmuramic acid kinase [Chloroflexota bacterium]|nr:anhydro-N-acetylmuramic acid kinase [Chloroflexota bacterium]